MTLADLLRKGILTVTLGAGAFFARDALAQGFDNKQDWDKPPQQQSTKITLDDQYDAGITASGKIAPKEQAISISGFLTYKQDDIRPSIYAVSSWQKFDNDIPLEVATNRLQARLGAYLWQAKDLELFINPSIGVENQHFTGAIKNNATRFMIGGDVGLGVPETGTRILVGIYGGIGRYNAELLSGFRTSGQFDSFFLGLSATQRLLGEGKKRVQITGEFDQKDIGEEFQYSLHAAVEAMMSKDKYGELRDQMIGNLRFSLPNVLNLREYGRDKKGNIYAKGTRWQFTPYVELQTSETESDISIAVTSANKYRVGIAAQVEFGDWVAVRVGTGYQWYKADTSGKVDEKNGITGEISLNIKH